MRFISRKVHAVLDYITGVLLIASPWLFNFADIAAAKWVAIIVGIVILGMALLTDYEGGLRKIISMRGHLMMDIIAGILLAVSPWLFNFSEYVYLPHLIIGILEIGAGSFTERSSEHSGRPIDRNISPAH
jgi:hypothetical protein